MDAAVDYLRYNNVRIQDEPVVMQEGPNAGLMLVYLLAPWGMQLELVSYPKCMAYEQTTARRLWRPDTTD